MDCKICGGVIQSGITLDGKRRSLQNRTTCLSCKQFNSRIKKTLEEKRKKWSAKQKRHALRFKERNGIAKSNLTRKLRKKEVIDIIGGKCLFCGYNRCMRNLSFHHVFPELKLFKLSEREFQFSWDKLVPEILKCVVVCHNCHGEIHEGVINNKFVQDKLEISKEMIISSKLGNFGVPSVE